MSKLRCVHSVDVHSVDTTCGFSMQLTYEFNTRKVEQEHSGVRIVAKSPLLPKDGIDSMIFVRYLTGCRK